MALGDFRILWEVAVVAIVVGWPIAKAQDICSCQNSAYPNERCCKPDGSSCWPGGTVTTVNGGFKCYDPAYPVANCGSGLFQYEAPTCTVDPTPRAPACQCLNSTYPDDRCCTTDGTCKPETLGGAAPTIVSGGFSCLDPAYPNPMCAPGLFDVANYYTYMCPTCNPIATNCVPPTASTSTDSTTTPATTATTTTVGVATTTTPTAGATTTTSTKTTTTAAPPEVTTSADYPDMTITFSESAATTETTTVAATTTKEQGSSTTPVQTTTLSESTTEPPATTTAGETTTQEATTTSVAETTSAAAETTTTEGETTSSAADTTTAALTTTEEPTTTTELATTTTTRSSGPCCGTWSAWTYTTTCPTGSCGTCQMRTKTRRCLSSSTCPCSGPTSWQEPCSTTPCTYPKKSCCARYVAQVISGKIVCTAPPVNPADSCVAPSTTATPPASCCGTWSAWTVTVGCPAGSCGACQTRTKTRSCLTSGACPCKGPTTITEPCSTTPCAYPKDSCCGSYKATSVGTAIVCAGPPPPNMGTCVPSTTTSTPRTTLATTLPPASSPTKCCPTGGIWSEWGPRLNCTDTCGAFGTAVRLRTCLTSAGSCPCTGSARTTVPCAFLPCTYPRNSCASGFKASKSSGKIRCVANVPPPVETVPPADCCPKGGVWTQWSTWSTCTTKCGSCSRVERTKSCASKRYGCPCAKNATTVAQRKYCNAMPCSYPEETCCSPFKVKSISGKLLCV